MCSQEFFISRVKTIALFANEIVEFKVREATKIDIFANEPHLYLLSDITIGANCNGNVLFIILVSFKLYCGQKNLCLL